MVQGDRLYSIGGTSWSTGSKEWLRLVSAWKIGQGGWDVVGHLPMRSGHAASMGRGDELYLFGGSDSSPATTSGLRITFQPRLAFSAAPSLPEPIALAASGSIGDLAIVAGGAANLSDLTTAHDRTYRLDLARGERWEAAPAIPGGPRAIAGAAACGDELLVFGGCYVDSSGKVVDRADAAAYSHNNGAWRPLADLPEAARGISAAAIDHRYVVLVGGYRSGFSDEVIIYDRQEDGYTRTLPLPTALGVSAVLVFGGKVYVLGGEDAPMSRTATAYIGALTLPVQG